MPLIITLFAALVSFTPGNTKALTDSSSTLWLPFLMAEDFEERVEQGQPDPDNPLVEPEMPWDAGAVFAHGTVLRDPSDGLWKVWWASNPSIIHCSKSRNPHVSLRPSLDLFRKQQWSELGETKLSLVPFEGFQQTNILLDLWCSYASVNVDPSRARVALRIVYSSGSVLPERFGKDTGLAASAGREKKASLWPVSPRIQGWQGMAGNGRSPEAPDLR